MALSRRSFTKKTIFVSISEAMSGKVPDIVLGTTTLEDIARGYWYLDLNKANQCEWLMAVDKGVIVGVWEIASPWHSAFPGATPTRLKLAVDPKRKYCNLRAVSSVVSSMFLNQRMASIFGIGPMHGPIRYSF